MNRSFSVYLDLVRFTAACLVYLYHSNQRWLVADILPMSNYGHSAVIVFFVLSGFVIAYVTDTKERDWVSYSASRLSRVFSVVVPALALCVVLDAVGRQLTMEPYSYPFDRFGARIVGSLLMLNEIWLISITSFSNVPYWSITYEFWYYVLFALVTFLPGRQGLWLAGALLLLLGPKIALLAPIWGAGVLLYRWRVLRTLSLGLSWALVVVSTGAIIVLYGLGVFEAISNWFKGQVGADLTTQLTFSKFFVADYLLTLLVFCNFAGMRQVAPSLAPVFQRLERPVKWLAGYTFTLYLLHQPLFLFWGAVFRGDPRTHGPWLAVTAATGASILVVGYFTENKRHHLKRAIERVLSSIERARLARASCA